MIYKISNKYIELEFCSDIHNIVSLVNKSTKDDYIKVKPDNCIFSLYAKNELGNKVRLYPNDAYRVNINKGEEYEKISCIYDSLFMEDKKIDTSVFVEILMERESDDIKFNISIDNREKDIEIIEVLYPHIRGVYLGEVPEDDILIYPHHAGEKIINPIYKLSTREYQDFWRAQSYYNEDKVYEREINYCGLASMMWMYYYDDKNGLYISSNDKDFLVTGIYTESGGQSAPWMGFSFRKYVNINNEQWKSNDYIISVNCNDWHYGARKYRSWIEPYLDIKKQPEYLKDQVVLNQCYNFKKEGKIYNRFENIPHMYEKGMEQGINHFFIAGWNRGGFDSYYPEFHPDMELGTSMDLYNGCEYINAHGGFATFYINCRIFDLKSQFYLTYGNKMAMKKLNGDVYTENYGTESFAVMCPSHNQWQKHIIDTAVWMVKSYNATGIYLDQLGSAEPFPCYDKAHSHDTSSEFNHGYRYMLSSIYDQIKGLNDDSFIMIENCGDIYGGYVWSNLTWNGPKYDECYNVFRYTFPEFAQVHMVNPVYNLQGEEQESKFKKDVLRAFVLGAVYWLGLTYKFNDKKEMLDYVLRVINLRKRANELIKNAQYMDDIGIISDNGYVTSKWVLDNNDIIVLVGNELQEEGSIWVELNNEPVKIIRIGIDLTESPVDVIYDNNKIRLPICDDEAGVYEIRHSFN
ncbi:DUF6259 domain-containing protein [Vallitalea maricola]|uniref:Uncharacterized protein n=1 Tax=Vallitalea maricola TaxID=3074433 RepID=A0ACB5UIH5_9FIRM|nr:hypothetical protein AN2V17_15650 [Vallitalea sp. AN17-2]